MRQEKLFYEELAKAPPLPSDIYNNIQKEISHNNTIKQTLFAFAASIVLILGSLQIITHQKTDNTTIQPEVASELQTIRDYLNGDDIHQDFDLYAVVDGY
ncbi:MAG TPA: hypothetical protein VKY57_09385 [Chitinispirillaceae bacterium]|jgi:hypothetical protein|nr:hypothetical protein [Chitinispirillaceae bacterium]